MSEVATTPETTQTPAPTPGPEPKVFSEEYVKQLRDEAANARISKKDAVEAAKAAADAEWAEKLQEAENRSTALETSVGEAWVYAAKVQEAIAAEVPVDKLSAFVEAMKGTDEASIKESAESLKSLFGIAPGRVPATDPTQGKGGGGSLPLNGDPILDKLAEVVGARR